MLIRFYQSKKLLSLVVAVFLAIVILEIWSANRLATFGEEMSKIEQAQQKLTLQNQLLEDKVAQASSLNSVESEARSIGFDGTSKIVYIDLPSLALKR